MRSAYKVAPLTDREQLAHWYTLDAAGAAAAFLDAHPFLTPLLLEAYPVLVQHFPQGDLFLRVSRDPEDPTWYELVAAINPGCEPAEALRRWDRFKQDWWLANMDRDQGLFFFHIDYIDAADEF